jgi:phage terminase large subunit-like protein
MDVRSGAAVLAAHEEGRVAALVASLSPREVAGLPYLWDFWALPHQLPPEGDWRTWVILGGRGAGKTRAGAEWVRAQVEGPRPRDPGRCRRVALVAETIDQAREVMVLGESGILACSPPDRRPSWIASRNLLVWPNGAQAQLFSAMNSEALRGPQFDCAWADEVAKWRKGDAWDQLQFGLRLGGDPRACVTTTPRNVAVLKDLLARITTVMTHAPTSANRANLAPGFLDEVEARYGGTRQGRQELDGELFEDVEGTLWKPAVIERAQGMERPPIDRVVVAVDPAVSSGKDSDSTGIVVVGASMRGPRKDWRAYVLEDATVTGATPAQWAQAVVDAAHRHGAQRVVAEVNQGGALVVEALRAVDAVLPVKAVHARQGKALRAEPVASLYEQGKVGHVRGLGALEAQMAQMTAKGFEGRGSPDRVDALVWALHEALIVPMAEPQVRGL